MGLAHIESGDAKKVTWSDLRDVPQDDAWSVLSFDEKSRAMRFSFDKHRKLFVAGRAFLRRELAAYLNDAPERIVLETGAYGKPFISGDPVFFNLSHSEHVAALALSDTGPVGIDVECVDRILDPLELGAAVFTPDEMEILSSLSPADAKMQFFRFWTAKEALMKFTGEGMSLAPNSIELMLSGNIPVGVSHPPDPSVIFEFQEGPFENVVCCLAQNNGPVQYEENSMTITSKSSIRQGMGRIFESAFPNVAKQIDDGANVSRWSWVKKLIVEARLSKAVLQRDEQNIQEAHFKAWSNDVYVDFHKKYSYRFDQVFLKHHRRLVDRIAGLTNRGEGYSRVVELGCGDGRVLDFCCEHLSQIDEFIGIDINASIISKNRCTYIQNRKLRFANGNGTEWLRDNACSRTLLMSYGGVLEYFSAGNVLQILNQLRDAGHCGVALCEPISRTHDLKNDMSSYPFGPERSFSHNYQHLLEKSGFDVRYCEIMDLDEARWVLIFADVAE